MPTGEWICVVEQASQSSPADGEVQHPDMTLVKVLWRVTFPLYLSPFCVAAFASREVSELLEICPLFSSPLQRHCQRNTQTT